MSTDSTASSSKQNKSDDQRHPVPLFLLIALVVVLWLGWYAWVSYLFEGAILPKIKDSSAAGTYGDLFGGINALFTGLGLAFLVDTIQQQQRMISQQTEALKLQSQDLTEQKKANNRSQALQAMLQLRSVLQDEDTRKARSLILSGEGKPDTPLKITEALLKEEQKTTLDDNDRAYLLWHKAAEKVLHTYDFVGVLWKGAFLEQKDLQVIKDTWGESIERCHDQLKDYLATPFRPKGRDFKSIPSQIDILISNGKYDDAVSLMCDYHMLHKLEYTNFVQLKEELKSMRYSPRLN
jgi:hypothetical protein